LVKVNHRSFRKWQPNHLKVGRYQESEQKKPISKLLNKNENICFAKNLNIFILLLLFSTFSLSLSNSLALLSHFFLHLSDIDTVWSLSLSLLYIVALLVTIGWIPPRSKWANNDGGKSDGGNNYPNQATDEGRKLLASKVSTISRT